MEFNWLLAVGLFFASLLLDAIFALYTVAVIKTQALRAASLSLVTYLLYAVGLLKFIDNNYYIVPLALGAFAGSYMVVKYEAVKKARKKSDKKH